MTNEEAATLLEKVGHSLWYQEIDGEYARYTKDHDQDDAITMAIAALRSPGAEELHIVFDGPTGRFVDVETADGRSINAGEWRKVGDYWHLVILRSPGAAEMREAAAKIAECAGEPYNDPEGEATRVTALEIARKIRALPLPAPEVPEPVRAYAEWLDDCRNALDDNDVPMKNLRSWIMEEYGI